MLKTCISVAAVGKAPEIVKGFIDKYGWPIYAIIIHIMHTIIFILCLLNSYVLLSIATCVEQVS